MSTVTAPQRRLKRRRRVRAKVRGSAERPRIAVFRSNRGIFAQLIDDDERREREATAALDDLGHAVDFHDALLEIQAGGGDGTIRCGHSDLA